MREIGTFCRLIKEAQRAGRKVNLRSNAKAFRAKGNNEHTHDEMCLFVHFLRDFQAHTTEAQFEDLMSRLYKGYLDKEPKFSNNVYICYMLISYTCYMV